MRSCCIAQGTLSSLLEQTKMKNNIQKTNIFICLSHFGTNTYQLYCMYVYVYVFLGPHLQRMEFRRLGSRIGAAAVSLCHSHSNTRLSHIFNLCHSSQQHQILNSLTKERDRTCILIDTSWVLNP